MGFEKEREAFERDGFVVVRQFLTGVKLAELRENLERYIRDVVPGQPSDAAFYQDRSRPETLKQMQHMACDAYFCAYVRQPQWVTLAESLLDEPAQADAPEWFNKPPGTEHATPPHQDNYYFCLKPSNVLTIWLALDAVDEENGCLRYVRGSHQRGLRPHGRTEVLGFSQGITDYGQADMRDEVAVHLQVGDAVSHHGMTIHRADANQSAMRHRRAFAMVFRGASCRRDEDAFARYQAALKAQHQGMGLQK
jgi:phytanoyl-CoA hydroxylase